VANFQPVYDYRIPAGNEIIVDAFANSWIDCMKLVVCSTVPDILPFFKAESGSTRFKVRCWYTEYLSKTCIWLETGFRNLGLLQIFFTASEMDSRH